MLCIDEGCDAGEVGVNALWLELVTAAEEVNGEELRYVALDASVEAVDPDELSSVGSAEPVSNVEKLDVPETELEPKVLCEELPVEKLAAELSVDALGKEELPKDKELCGIEL